MRNACKAEGFRNDPSGSFGIFALPAGKLKGIMSGLNCLLNVETKADCKKFRWRAKEDRRNLRNKRPPSPFWRMVYKRPNAFTYGCRFLRTKNFLSFLYILYILYFEVVWVVSNVIESTSGATYKFFMFPLKY